MRRLVALALVGTLAFTFVGSPASRAATVASSWPVGGAPFGLALDDSTGKVYVADSGSVVSNASNPSETTGRVSVVDPATGSVATLATSQISNFVLTDSPNRRLYSSNYNFSTFQKSVDVFDLDSGARLASVFGVGGLMLALDAPAGRLFVGSNSLAVIDTVTDAVVASLPPSASGGWFGVAVDPARHRLYLSDSDTANPRIVVVDDRDLSPIGQVVLGNTVRYAIAVDQTRNLVYVAGSNPRGAVGAAFYVIDPDSLTVTHSAALDGFPLGIAIAQPRGRIYVSTEAGLYGSPHIYGIDDSTFAIAESMRITQFQPGMPLFHPDGRLYIGNYNDVGNPVLHAAVNSNLLALDLSNHAPIIQTVTLTPSPASTGDTVRVNAGAYDPDFSASIFGDPLTYAYEWSRNGTVITGATQSTLDLSVGGNGDRGDTISVLVTATDPQGASASRAASFTVADAPPVIAAQLNTTSPRTNDVLTVIAQVSDADGDPVTTTYEWLRNGTVVSGATSASFDLAALGDRGDTITARVTASDDHGASTLVSLDALVVDTAPTVGLALSNQSPRTNDVLVATASGFDPDADTLRYEFELWLNGNYVSSGLSGSNASSWNLANPPFGNRGDTVTIFVTAWDGTLWSQRVSAAAVIVNSPPEVTVSLSDRTPGAKTVLVATADGSDADGDPLTFTYTWQVGKKVRQTTTTTATTSAFDLTGQVSNGDVVTVTVTASDGYAGSTGATDSATVTNNPKH